MTTENVYKIQQIPADMFFFKKSTSSVFWSWCLKILNGDDSLIFIKFPKGEKSFFLHDPIIFWGLKCPKT